MFIISATNARHASRSGVRRSAAVFWKWQSRQRAWTLAIDNSKSGLRWTGTYGPPPAARPFHSAYSANHPGPGPPDETRSILSDTYVPNVPI